jgi:hypothetical protein
MPRCSYAWRRVVFHIVTFAVERVLRCGRACVSLAAEEIAQAKCIFSKLPPGSPSCGTDRHGCSGPSQLLLYSIRTV